MSTVNCYPDCSYKELITKLLRLNPCIDITVLNTSLALQSIQAGDNKDNPITILSQKAKAIRNSTDSKEGATMGNASATEKAFQTGLDGEASGASNKTDDIHVLDNVFGFYSLMTASFEEEYTNIPIANSPQIQTNNSGGFKGEQSLLSFIKALGTQGLTKILMDAGGVTDVFTNVIDEIERIAGLAGWSPRVSPYFSLAENPFSEKPRLSAEIKLINDSEKHLYENTAFLDTVVRNSLIASGSARKSGVGTESGVASRWYPPKLFNVGLKWGADIDENGQEKKATSYVKRYHFCTLEATVSPEGVMRMGFPDAYSVNLNFTSLFPDTLDFWSKEQGKSSVYETGFSNHIINKNK